MVVKNLVRAPRNRMINDVEFSMIAMVLSLIHASDIAEGLKNPCLMFADTIKPSRSANNEDFQGDMDKLYQWSVR